MRKDIYERMKLMQKDGIKPNYAKLAKQYNCDYRTIKRYFENDIPTPTKRVSKPRLIDPFKTIIETKYDEGCTASAIYHFIAKRGYKGKYTAIKEYCHSIKQEKLHKATIRFETNPGLQSQVDWKERLTMFSKYGEVFEFNIFLTILGYSRYKYIELTLDRTQKTLESAMIHSFEYFNGVPKEIIFDNMRTVIDQSRTQYQKAVINERFYEFSKDIGFEIWACRAYRPQTKGKVEALAKFTSRLKPYNHEFADLEELDQIIRTINIEMNKEVCSSTGTSPEQLWKKEKEYLLPLPNQNILSNYLSIPLKRIVQNDSMITYKNNKYSLNPKYIGKVVELKVSDNILNIIYQNIVIASHKLSERKLNYHMDDYVSILKSDAFKHKDIDEIESFAKEQLKIYDQIG